MSQSSGLGPHNRSTILDFQAYLPQGDVHLNRNRSLRMYLRLVRLHKVLIPQLCSQSFIINIFPLIIIIRTIIHNTLSTIILLKYIIY